MSLAGWALLALGACGLGLFAVVNPLLTALAAALRGPRRRPGGDPGVSVSLLVVVRNGRGLIGPKLDNALALDAPRAGLEIIVYSDGSSDGTREAAEAYAGRGVVVSGCAEHRGKAAGLNAAAALATGDVLVLSDADALLAPDAVTRLASWFALPEVGGVCGRRVVAGQGGGFEAAQAGYVRLDSRLKEWESRLGALTSNDGKLYAVRRALFPEVPGAVTDDFHVLLSVVRAGRLFLFDDGARAAVPVPSRSPGVELRRRRRIVSTSLNALAIHRELLRPARHGLFALRLACNKLLRRLMPVFLLCLLTGSALTAGGNAGAAALLAALLGGLALAAGFPLLRRAPRPVARVSGAAFYFFTGNLGMLLGLVDFARGALPERWNPDKGPAPK